MEVICRLMIVSGKISSIDNISADTSKESTYCAYMFYAIIRSKINLDQNTNLRPNFMYRFDSNVFLTQINLNLESEPILIPSRNTTMI